MGKHYFCQWEKAFWWCCLIIYIIFDNMVSALSLHSIFPIYVIRKCPWIHNTELMVMTTNYNKHRLYHHNLPAIFCLNAPLLFTSYFFGSQAVWAADMRGGVLIGWVGGSIVTVSTIIHVLYLHQVVREHWQICLQLVSPHCISRLFSLKCLNWMSLIFLLWSFQ